MRRWAQNPGGGSLARERGVAGGGIHHEGEAVCRGGGWGLEERGALRRMAKVGNSSGRRGQNLLVRNTRNCQAVLMAQLPLRVRTWGDPLSLGGTI